jgi:hypothetical protein
MAFIAANMRERIEKSTSVCDNVFESCYAVAHDENMHDYSISHSEISYLLLAMLEVVPGGTQESLAEYIGASQPDISAGSMARNRVARTT